jgi:hypothetical protein
MKILLCAYLHFPDNRETMFLIPMPVSMSTLRNANVWICLPLVDYLFPTTLMFILFQRHVIFAQDALRRDVAIKIIRTNSHEERIHDLVLRQPQSFNNVLPTIEIIRSPHDFSFVVTPRCVWNVPAVTHRSIWRWLPGGVMLSLPPILMMCNIFCTLWSQCLR